MSKNKYYKHSYDHLARWSSYWRQINEVMKLKPKKVLEIGAGNQTVAGYLKERNILVTALDIDKNLKPDVVASVTDIPLGDNTYDLVLAAQVLEHLPFVDLPKALKEIFRVSRKYAVISLPQWGRIFQLHIKVPVMPHMKLLWKAPGFKRHRFCANGHYWEVGKRGYSLRKIKNIFLKNGFKIIKDYVVFEHPYHHFFVLDKN